MQHQKRMASLNEEIGKVNQSTSDTRLEAEQTAIYTQKKKDLLAAVDRAKKAAERSKQRAIIPGGSVLATSPPQISAMLPSQSGKSSKAPLPLKAPKSTKPTVQLKVAT